MRSGWASVSRGSDAARLSGRRLEKRPAGQVPGGLIVSCRGKTKQGKECHGLWCSFKESIVCGQDRGRIDPPWWERGCRFAAFQGSCLLSGVTSPQKAQAEATSLQGLAPSPDPGVAQPGHNRGGRGTSDPFLDLFVENKKIGYCFSMPRWTKSRLTGKDWTKVWAMLNVAACNCTLLHTVLLSLLVSNIFRT